MRGRWCGAGTLAGMLKGRQAQGRVHPAGEQACGQASVEENILLRACINHSDMATQALLFWLSRMTLST